MKLPFTLKPNKKTPARPQPIRHYNSRRFTNQISRHPFLVITLLAVTLVLGGTGGYMVIEGWGFLDALYMTTITITTIGYGEVLPLSPSGRLYTIALIVVGVVIASYTVTAIIELLTSEKFLRELRNRRRRRMLSKLDNHCIICGFGRMGSSLAAELQSYGTPVVAIDPASPAVERCESLGILALQGSGADDRVLREAGIERAKSLVAATKSDAENVFIILTASGINPNLQIISRCNSEASIEKLKKAGANTVISPYSIAGKRIANMITHPNVTSFLDGVLEFGDRKMRLEEFVVSPQSRLAGLSLKEARLSVVVLAVHTPGQTVFTHPNADTTLTAGSAFIAMGLEEDLLKLADLIN